MQKQFSATLCAVSAASIIALVVTLLPAASAPAANECLAAPKGPAGAGQHWWYRRDRATGKQCWYLGSKDPGRAAAQARAEASAADSERPRPAATPQTMRTASASAAEIEPEDEAPAGRARGVAFLLDWSDLLRAAGMVGPKEPALNAPTDEERALPAQTTGSSEGAQSSQPAPVVAAAAREDRTTGPFVQMLLIVGAALLIAGAIWQAIFSLARWLHERSWLRRARRMRPVPAEMQPRDLTAPPPANTPGRRPKPADPYGPFDPDELQRILDRLRHAA